MWIIFHIHKPQAIIIITCPVYVCSWNQLFLWNVYVAVCYASCHLLHMMVTSPFAPPFLFFCCCFFCFACLFVCLLLFIFVYFVFVFVMVPVGFFSLIYLTPSFLFCLVFVYIFYILLAMIAIYNSSFFNVLCCLVVMFTASDNIAVAHFQSMVAIQSNNYLYMKWFFFCKWLVFLLADGFTIHI